MSLTVYPEMPAAATTGQWSNWTPSWTGLTVGNGTLNYARYAVIGSTVHFRLEFVWGSTTSASGGISFTLPTNTAAGGSNGIPAGSARLQDSSASTSYEGELWTAPAGGNTCSLLATAVGGSRLYYVSVTGTDPFTFAVNDAITVCGTYEA